MARVKIKVERGNGLQQVVTVDTEATKGARLGRDVYLPDGTVATPASMRSWMGVSQGTAAPTAAGSSLQSVLTNKGDLATRNTQVQRLAIGTQDQALRVSAAGLPEWRSGAALTKTDDTNVTLTLGGNHATALLGAASITVGWSGTLAQGRGGWGADISAASGYPKFTAGVAAFSGSVPWGDVSSTPTTLAGYGITDAYTKTDVDGMFDDLVDTYLPANYQPLSSVLTAYAGGSTPSAFTLGIVDSVDAAAWRAAIGAGTSSFDGAFSSLSGIPTTISGYGITDAYTETEVDTLLLDYATITSLAPVAFSGDYDDLTNIPAILGEFTGLANAAGVLTNDGSGNLSWAPAGGSGTVTSVGLSAPTGLSVSGSPVTTSGTLALSWAAGYQGYTTAEASKLSGIASGATVGATWGTNLNSIPPIISTFAALANGSGVLTNDGSGNLSWSAGGGAATWGSITGTLSDQTDLQSALNGKQASSSVLTAYAGGNTPSAFTLGIVNAANAAAWRAAIGAGTSSLTIGGSNGQIQFNNSGSLDGSSGLTWNAGTSTLTATNIAGNGSSITALNAGNLTTGTVADARLSSNVALKNGANVFTQTQRIAYTGGGEQLRLSHDDAWLSFYNSANNTRTGYLWMPAGNSSQLWVETNQALQIGTNNTTRMTIGAAGNVSIFAPSSGTALTVNGGLTLASGALTLPAASIADAALSSNVALKNANNTWSGSNTFSGNLSVGGTISGSGAGIIGVVHTTGTETIGGSKRFTSTVNIHGDDAHGFISATVGGVSNTGYIAFHAPGGTRQGYIGWSSSSASTDTGTIPYVAGVHAFAGDVTVSGSITGSGSGLTSLNASNISSGTINDARLSSNVALKNANNMFTGTTQTISGTLAEWQSLDGTVAASMRAWSGGALGLFGTTSNHGLQIRTNDAARIAITDGGNVTINAPASGTALTVNGSVQIGSPTGGDKGAGTLNTAGNIFLNNNPVPCIISGGTAGGGRITISTSAPSGTPADGDMWFQNGIWVGRSGAWAPVANSGTYTPTGAAGTNVTSVTVEECQYLRVGSVVTVSGRVTVIVSSSGIAAFYLTLPVASDLTDQNDLCGVASTTVGDVWAVHPDVTINRALFETMVAPSGSRVLYFTFTYSII